MRQRYMPLVVSALLLGVMAAETASRPTASDAEPFHARIRAVTEQSPKVIGDWVGTDIPFKPAALALLRPNARLHRQFVNQATGRVASFLLVQCGTARDMLGHYPPVCYPAQGWDRRPSQAVQWTVGDMTIPGMEYVYSRVYEGQLQSCVVSNLLILPDGRFVHTMDEVEALAADYQRQFYGAAQIQIVVDADVRAEERREIVQTLLGANLKLLEALRSGGTR